MLSFQKPCRIIDEFPKIADATNYTEIKYTKNGREYIDYFKLSMRDVLDWIKSNINENATILCWWDYGGMVIGYCERNTIARFASLALKDTLHPFVRGWFDEEEKKKFIEEDEWASNDTIEDIANVLTTTNFTSDKTKGIIEKYNVSYILTYIYDLNIARVFFDAGGKNPDEYIVNGVPTEKGIETLIFRMWSDDAQIPELQLCYNVADVRIFDIL